MDNTSEVQTPEVQANKVAFSVPETLALTGISRSKFYEMVRAGEGPPIRAVGRRRIILRDELTDWLKSLDHAA